MARMSMKWVVAICTALGIIVTVGLTNYEDTVLLSDQVASLKRELNTCKAQVITQSNEMKTARDATKLEMDKLLKQVSAQQQQTGSELMISEELKHLKSEHGSLIKKYKEIKARLKSFEKSSSEPLPSDSVPIGTSEQEAVEFNRYSALVSTSQVLHRKRNSVILHSDTLMRRSRPIVGNTERIKMFIRKLLDKQCTSILFVGGSVTHATRNVEGEYVSAYHQEFVRYLNEQYPCEGGSHKLHVHGPGGTDAAYAVQNFPQLFRGTGGHVDFVSFEYAVNDASTPPLPGHNVAESVQVNNEILIRKALSYRNKDGSTPAVIWLETSFFWSNLKKRDMYTAEGSTHVFTAGVHFPILSYYDIPTVSAAQMIFPMMVKDLDSAFEKKSPIGKFFMDHCHPSYGGHRFVSQAIANMIETEKAWMLKGPEPASLEADLTLSNPPKLPNPWWLSDTEMDLLVNAQTSEFSFQTDIPKEDALLFNTGWTIYADSKKKFGLISTKSASHVAFELEMIDFNADAAWSSGGSADDYKSTKKGRVKETLQASNKITLGYLRSYTNLSDLIVWTDAKPDGRELCENIVTGHPGACYEVGCSCYTMKQLRKKMPRSGSYLHRALAKKWCEDEPSFIPEVTGEPKLYDYGDIAPDTVSVDLIHPLQRVHTSVFASTDIRFSAEAIEAASNGKPIYLHACNTRFDEYKKGNITSAAMVPEPVEGDGKFKILLLATVNGNVKIEKDGEREIGRL